MMLDILLYSGNVWLIIGLLLAILELTNGTLIFFLPTGASGLLTGLILKLQESEALPILLDSWPGALTVSYTHLRAHETATYLV